MKNLRITKLDASPVRGDVSYLKARRVGVIRGETRGESSIA